MKKSYRKLVIQKQMIEGKNKISVTMIIGVKKFRIFLTVSQFLRIVEPILEEINKKSDGDLDWKKCPPTNNSV